MKRIKAYKIDVRESMATKKFEVDIVYMIIHSKKSKTSLFLITNSNRELDFFHHHIEVEGIGFNEEKAKDKIRDFLIQNILGKGAMVMSQKMIFQKTGMRKFMCKYIIDLTDAKVNIKNGEFYPLQKTMNVKNRMSDLLREFLVKYIAEKNLDA